MAKNFGNSRSVEMGRRAAVQDVNSDKYRIACIHVHILALGCAMVGCAFHLLMIYEDLKKGRYYRLARHAPCALLFLFVILGNRMYKTILYQFYLIFNFFFVGFIIVAEAFRQYKMRTDPELKAQLRHSIYFFVCIWAVMLFFEIIIYYTIYRDWKFVKDVKDNPPTKVESIRHRDRTEPA